MLCCFSSVQACILLVGNPLLVYPFPLFRKVLFLKEVCCVGDITRFRVAVSIQAHKGTEGFVELWVEPHSEHRIVTWCDHSKSSVRVEEHEVVCAIIFLEVSDDWRLFYPLNRPDWVSRSRLSSSVVSQFSVQDFPLYRIFLVAAHLLDMIREL